MKIKLLMLLIVICSNCITIAQNDNSLLDLSFNNTGYHFFNNFSTRSVNGIAEFNDKIRIVGLGNDDDYTAVQLNTSGGIDTSFGNNGFISSSPTFASLGGSVAITETSEFILTGRESTGGASDGFEYKLIKLQSNGFANLNFGNAGEVVSSINGESENAKLITRITGGRFLFARETTNNIFLATMDSDGSNISDAADFFGSFNDLQAFHKTELGIIMYGGTTNFGVSAGVQNSYIWFNPDGTVIETLYQNDGQTIGSETIIDITFDETDQVFYVLENFFSSSSPADLHLKRFDTEGNFIDEFFYSSSVDFGFSPQKLLFIDCALFILGDSGGGVIGGDIFAAKLDVNGNFDTTFGSNSNGVALIDLPEDVVVRSILKDENDRVYVSGRFNIANGIYVARLLLSDFQITNCPNDITQVNDSNNCNAIVNWDLPSFTSDCSTGTLSSTHNPGDTFPLGTTTVTYTLTNESGNSVSCSFDVTITDSEDPVLTNCPTNISQNTDAGLNTSVVNWTPPTASDNCMFTLSASHNPGDTFVIGTTTVTYTATDDTGNSVSCSFDVTITDNENPVLTNCPTDIMSDTDTGLCNAVVNWTPPTASDNDNVSITSTHNPGDTFVTGTTMVTYTATDLAGNSVSCSFDVTVTDSEDPVLTNCPTDISQNTDAGSNTAVVNWTPPTASDNCMFTLSASHNPGDIFAVGTTTVTYTATDDIGNTVSCSFDIAVTDNEDPVLTNCPTDIMSDTDTGLCNAVVNWTPPTASDNDNVSITSTHNPGDTFLTGTTMVTYTATDLAGNSVSCSFDITVTDSEDPEIINCPTDIMSDTDAGLNTAVVNWTPPTASDNCMFTLSTSHNPGDAFAIGTTMVTYTATDDTGNTVSCSFDVTITDNEDPVLTNCPTDIMSDTDTGVCNAVVNWTPPTASDNDNVSITSTHNSGDTFVTGTTMVTYTATDLAGNSVSCSFNITITDNENPEITCPADQSVPPEVSGGIYTVPDYFATGEAVAIDNCTTTVTIVSQDPVPGTELLDGTFPISLTAEDDNGNSITCTFNLTVDSTLGLENDINISKLNLYPNPTNGLLTLDSPKTILTKVELYDLRGRLIKRKTFSNTQSYTLNISQVESAIYLVYVYSNNSKLIKKVIKE